MNSTKKVIMQDPCLLKLKFKKIKQKKCKRLISNIFHKINMKVH